MMIPRIYIEFWLDSQGVEAHSYSTSSIPRILTPFMDTEQSHSISGTHFRCSPCSGTGSGRDLRSTSPGPYVTSFSRPDSVRSVAVDRA